MNWNECEESQDNEHDADSRGGQQFGIQKKFFALSEIPIVLGEL